LLPSDPGGIQWELVVKDLPSCKSNHWVDKEKDLFLKNVENILRTSFLRKRESKSVFPQIPACVGMTI